MMYIHRSAHMGGELALQLGVTGIVKSDKIDELQPLP